jgi:hypothetical protein
MLAMLDRVIELLYRYEHLGKAPPIAFKNAIQKKIKSHKNPSESEINKIKRSIDHAVEQKNEDDVLRQVAASEKALSIFSFLSGRTAIATSSTALSHWVALVKKMKELDRKYRDKKVILDKLGTTRYGLNFNRMSKLIGDNPICIDREPSHYNAKGRKHFEEDHPELIEQTAYLNPRITGNARDTLRLAGNACWITEPDRVIEFRQDDDNLRLYKYIIESELLVVVDDLRFLRSPSGKLGKIPLAKLVTLFRQKMTEGGLAHELGEQRYLPNCVDLKELALISSQVEKEMGC